MKTLRLVLALLFTAASARAELRVPAFTAYLEPDANGAKVGKDGITGWANTEEGVYAGIKPPIAVSWFGEIKMAGKLDASVVLRVPKGAMTKLLLTVEELTPSTGKVHGRRVSASANETGTGEAVPMRFGQFTIERPGYVRFELGLLNAPGKPAGDLVELVLDGPAVKDAHFNMKERRNAASVHLAYQTPKDSKVDAFYCEVTAVEDPVATYYMATGWNRGYFGMQVNSATERRIIFSVWDGGSESKDRSKVADENRTKLLAKGEGVSAGDFGNEGTGGHSHLVYSWKTGEVQKFVVTAKPSDETHTVYSGYWFHPEKKQWMLISSWNAPQTGGWLKGLYSFSENFGGSNGQLRRKALYGNQWLRTDDGKWHEVAEASFSHDGTGKEDRLDRFMGVENGRFFLSHGGFMPGFTKYGEKFTRPASGTPPALQLPTLPAAP